jgi:hypothetical protein
VRYKLTVAMAETVKKSMDKRSLVGANTENVQATLLKDIWVADEAAAAKLLAEAAAKAVDEALGATDQTDSFRTALKILADYPNALPSARFFINELDAVFKTLSSDEAVSTFIKDSKVTYPEFTDENVVSVILATSK